MSENWFQKKIDEITVKDNNSTEKKFVNTYLQKNIMYIKHHFNDALNVKYKKYNESSK